jgi:hypothetical protein|tara:strand:+ start:531 stop:737 length:207 start_codon:yes stop_codon:yes gene_type:complete
MKYKLEYEDSNHKKHARYYSAIDPNTAKEMFKATVDHSFGDKEVTILGLYQLGKRWSTLSEDKRNEKE